MDIEGGSVFATTNDLISFRYPLNSSTPSPCSSSSVLLSSPWPISNTPSPPSSTSSTCSPPSMQPLNEGTILSLSSSSSLSPSSATATSPVPMELGVGTAVIFSSSASGHTNSSNSSVACSTPNSGLALVDPVSSHALEVAHAPGKSILCVHEQEQGDLIHFSTSSCSTNRVNGNGNEDEHQHQTNVLSLSDCEIQSPSSSSNTDGNLFPTLILTSATTSHHSEHDTTSVVDGMIPMRLYASLTSAPVTTSSSSIPPSSCANDNNSMTLTSTINGSILTTALGGGACGVRVGGDGGGDNDNAATCILMTTHGHNQNDDDLHHQLHGHGEDDTATFTLTGFTSTNDTNDLVEDSTVTTLGTTTILMDGSYGEEDKVQDDMAIAKLSSDPNPLDEYKEYSSSHGKLKDILMNGHNNSNNHHHHHQQQQQQHQHQHHHNLSLLSSTTQSTNGDGYILRDLEAASVIYTSDGMSVSTSSGVNRVTVTDDCGNQQTAFLIPKTEEEEDDLGELKLHSVCEDQTSFTDAINSIYNSTAAGRNPFCDGNGDLTTINNGDLVLVSGGQGAGDYTSGGVITSVSSISSRSESLPSVIWTNSGGVVEAIGSSPQSTTVSAIPPQMLHHPRGTTIILKDEDLGDLDEIDEDDLLEAKEEPADYDYGIDPEGDEVDGDTQGGVKGELKCKFCGFVCCSKSSLGIHERRHTGERPFSCRYCGRLFNSAQCCKHHERLHTGDKPFICSYCGKKYAVSTRLKRHERVHTREEPYKCTECNKTFRWFDAFRDHRNTHNGVPLYLCSVCGKTFTSYLKFYYHERGHLMKKERDRDRLAKQRELSGGPSNLELLIAKRFIAKRRGSYPVSHTIDILQSLQRNSSEAIISDLNAMNAAALQNTPLMGKKSAGGGQSQGKGQTAKKSGSKTNSKKSNSSKTSQNNSNLTSGINFSM